MTNEELQTAILQEIAPLSAYKFLERKDIENKFPVCKRAVYDIARGNFESREVGKFGIMKMKDYYSTKDDLLEND